MAFFRDPSTGVQSFGIQSFPSAQSGHGGSNGGAGYSPGAVHWRIACGNCGNPYRGPAPASPGIRRQATAEKWVRWWVEGRPIARKYRIYWDFRQQGGGQGGIRTRGGCYTTHAFQACALSHSATCPFSAVGRSYSAVDRLGNGVFPRPSRLARVHAAI